MGADLRSEEGLTSISPMLRSLFDASILHFFDAEMISVFHPTNVSFTHFSHWKFMKLSLSCFFIRQCNDIKIMQDDAHRWTSAAYFRILLSRKSQRSVHHRRKARKKYVLWNYEKKIIKIMWNKETRKY